MFKYTWIALASLTTIVASLVVWQANATRLPHPSTLWNTPSPLHTLTPAIKGNPPSLTSSPCLSTLTQHAVCMAANRRALELMSASNLNAVIVIQEVRTGALIVFAASHPLELDVTTPVSPLSLSKILLSASWWDNGQPNHSFDSTKGDPQAKNLAFRSRVTIHEMLVGGSDSAGRQSAVALRKSVGTKKVLEDLARYGFAQRSGPSRDEKFWGEVAADWKVRLTPATAYFSLNEETKDEEWAETLSLGEINMSVTALHISRFLQAAGNNGVMFKPLARQEEQATSVAKSNVFRLKSNGSIRIMRESTALRLQSAMRDTVQRGTATSIAKALEDTGWQIGGKTGSGLALLPKGDLLDGWFAGLIFDPQKKARFTVATFVRSGGRGGENAAKISASLARYIIGAQTTSSR